MPKSKLRADGDGESNEMKQMLWMRWRMLGRWARLPRVLLLRRIVDHLGILPLLFRWRGWLFWERMECCFMVVSVGLQ